MSIINEFWKRTAQTESPEAIRQRIIQWQNIDKQPGESNEDAVRRYIADMSPGRFFQLYSLHAPDPYVLPEFAEKLESEDSRKTLEQASSVEPLTDKYIEDIEKRFKNTEPPLYWGII